MISSVVPGMSGNYGVSGTTMLKNADNPYWNKKQYSTAKSFNPDYIIIELGTNDSKDYNWNAFGADFEKDYSAMIREFAALPSTPTIILCKQPKAFVSTYGINDNTIYTQINPTIQSIRDKGVNLIIVDLYALFKDHPELMSDGIHPNKNGAALMAETFKTVLLGNPPNNHSNAAPLTARMIVESDQLTEDDNELSVYPIPSEDKIVIETKAQGKSSIQVHAVDRSVIQSHEIDGPQKIELLKQQFGSGLFFIVIKNDQGKTVTKKIIFN
jgi:lysophospholipase L1-like esterase